MKKILMITIAVLMFTVVNAQTEKGKMMLGGNLNISGNKFNEGRYKWYTLGISLNPKYGYFITNNFVLGAKLRFTYDYKQFMKDETTGSVPLYDPQINSAGFGGGIFTRYYVKITDKFMFFANADISYLYGMKSEIYRAADSAWGANNPGIQHTYSNSVSVAISPGLVYFVTPKLGVETSFGSVYYSFSDARNVSLPDYKPNRTQSFGINLNGSTFYFGLNYYF